MKKPAKVVLTTALGAALLLGGSTYALWSSNVTPDSSAIIQTGDSGLSPLNAGQWIDSGLSEKNPTDPAIIIEDINKFRAVPSDKVTFEQNFKVSATGNNSKTKFSVTMPENETVSFNDLHSRGVTLSIQIADGETGDILASTSNDASALETVYTFDGPTGAEGKNLEARFVFDFSESVTEDDTKNLKTMVDNATVVVSQA